MEDQIHSRNVDQVLEMQPCLRSSLDVHIEPKPSPTSSMVTIEEIAPQNDTISDEKETRLSNQICCFIKSVKDKRLSTAEKNVRRYY